MSRLLLPSPLRGHVGGSAELNADGATVGEVLLAAERRHPQLKGWILDERGDLRQHIHLFVNDERAELSRAVGPADEVYVLQAISGGTTELELLVGTAKGLFVLRGPRGGDLMAGARQFPGQAVEYATRDPRTGRCFASVTHGQFGPHLYFAESPEGPWEEADGPAFPADAGAAIQRTWVVTPGEEEGVLWAGVAPAALFKSEDGGQAWALHRALWDHPTRPQWEGGAGGLCLHSICTWPGEPQRLAVGISAAGVWLTEDGGESWRWGGSGLVPRYLPEEARPNTLMLCVHNMHRAPLLPHRLYLQFHGGVYRSDDAGETWHSIGAGLPSDFGFPLVVDPRDPERAFVIPLMSDEDRVAPEGRLSVFETRDGGGHWRALDSGFPEAEAWVTVLRQAFAHDGAEPLGLYFGTRSGELYGSVDDGATWSRLAESLPAIHSVRCTLRDGA